MRDAANLPRQAPPGEGRQILRLLRRVRALELREGAAELERALRDDESDALTLAKAALASGYWAEHLRHLIARGELQNAGRRGAPRVRRGDLPRKAKATPTGYDPAADALQLHRASRR